MEPGDKQYPDDEGGASAAHDEEDDEAVGVSVHEHDEDDEINTVRSEMTNEEDDTPAKPKVANGGSKSTTSGKKRKKPVPPPGRKGRAPAVEGLTIPFRAVKRIMKLDKDVGTVQNEAAILTTLAAEQFLKCLSKQSHKIAKTRGRNTVRYEDVAEARTKEASLSFLERVLP